MKRRRVTKKKGSADLKFWLIHSSHWVAAFFFIFTTLSLVYIFFAGDAVFAEAVFPSAG